MLKRTNTSVVLISIVAAAIFLLPVWAFTIVASIFISLGLYEFFRLDPKNIFPKSFIYIGIFSGAALPYITYLLRHTGGRLDALFFIVILIALFLIQFTRKESQNAVTLIALTLFGVFYVGWFFTYLVKIRFLEDGHKLVVYLLLVTKAGDIGAYLVGSKFGRHRLIQRISPKKSIEGAAGGFFFSIIFALLSRSFLGWMSFGAILTGGILIGVFAQLGDLAESLMKRDYQVKDSSPFLPGLGGMLDVIDSVLFTAPIFYIYLMIVM
ncbi:MAG: phosphatidate cytidylyltransferase [Candidatus Omnitrophica bacterium]|nr:phosphatidate cytidylyltransferase [Candidatus Omnitrophota bacterium]MBU4590263.1 phosphatidate cytidylyltransferase [Candidatus Omnitrophota bacterium]